MDLLVSDSVANMSAITASVQSNAALGFDNTISWSDIAQILIACASLVVSFFAYRLAKKISFKRTVKDRQFEVVSQFIRAFTSSLISISWQNSNRGGGGSLFYLSQMRSKKFLEENSDLMFDERLIIQEDGFNHFNFVPLIGDPFLPNELYEELRKFWYHGIEKINNPQSAESYLIICNHKDYSNPNYWHAKNPEFKNFRTFHAFINRIMNIADQWLEQYEASELKFKN